MRLHGRLISSRNIVVKQSLAQWDTITFECTILPFLLQMTKTSNDF